MKKKIFQAPWVPLLLLLLLWVLFHKALLFSGKTLILADSSAVFYPLWKWGSQVVKEGLIPLWCSDASFGTPYLADPQNLAWYPPKLLLYRFLEPTPAFTVLLLLHSLWTLAGVWLLVRERGGSPWASFWACLILGLSFNSVILPWSTSMPVAFSWTPWILFSFGRFLEGKRGSWLFLSLCSAFQWSAGYPLFGYMTGFFLLLDGIARGTFRKDRVKMDRTVPFFAAIGAALFFNSAWLLPLIELLPHSNLSLRAAMPVWGNWRDLGTLFNPFFLGHPLFTADKELIFRVYFMGLPTLALLFLGMIGQRIPGKVLGVCAGLVVLSLGEGAWIGGVLKSLLPGYHWVARSGYWIPFIVLFVALVSAEALESLLKEPLKDPRGLRYLVPLGLYGAALVAGVPWDLSSLWLSLLLLVGALAGKTPPGARAPLFCAALALSLLPAARAIHFTAHRSYYDQEPKLASQLRDKGRIHQSPEWVDGYRVLSGQGVLDAYRKAKEALVPNWGLAYGLKGTLYSHSLFLRSGLDWAYSPSRVPREASRKFLDLLGVGVLAQTGPDPSALYRPNPGAFSLWFPVRRTFLSGTLEEDWARVASRGFDPARDGLVEREEWVGTYSPRRVREVSRTPNRLALKASGRGRAMLFSSEAAYPGWRAVVGDQERPWVRVNHDFRGMVLEEGEQEASMAFEPATFRLGAFLSLLACAGWAFGLARIARRWFHA